MNRSTPNAGLYCDKIQSDHFWTYCLGRSGSRLFNEHRNETGPQNKGRQNG